MSSNLIFNKIDINHRSKNEIINSYILDDIKKNINNKKYQDKIKNDINHQSKVSIDFQDGKNKNIINLENVYKNAIVSLENLKKETEKNIFFTKKYSENINNHFIQNHLTNNNLFSQNVLMKKKFLINHLLTFSIKQ